MIRVPALTRRRVLVGLAMIVCAGCLEPIPPPLRVGMALWPPYEVFRLAEGLGFYSRAEVQLVDFGSLAGAQRAYEADLIDVLCTTGEYALYQDAREHRIVLVIDFSNGGDTLVARRGIGALRELRGKRVGLEAGVLGVYVLTLALDRAGMSTRDVVLVPVDLVDHRAAFESGRVDAIVTYEPVRTQILAQGGRELFSSRDIPGEIVDVMVVRTRLLERRGAAMKTLVDGWFHGLDYLAQNPTDAARRMAAHQGVTAEEYLRSLDGVRLSSLEENRHLLAGPSSPLAASLRRLSEAATRHGILEEPVDPAPLLDDRLVRATPP